MRTVSILDWTGLPCVDLGERQALPQRNTGTWTQEQVRGDLHDTTSLLGA